jgi:hypothetical protein
VDFVKLLLVRYFSETLGMRYVGESGNVVWFEEGLNRVAVLPYFVEVYEEAEVYKRVGELMGVAAAKVYLAVLPEAAPFVDPRYFKNQGVGLVVVDPARGLDGVEIKIFARPRPTPTADSGRLAESLRASLAEYLDAQLKRLEASLYEKLRRYVDEKIEEIRRQLPASAKPETAPKPPETPPPAPPSSVADNEWVRILRSRRREG